MARLDYEINIRSKHTPIPGLPYPNGSGNGIMNFRVWFGVKGSPQYRLNGGSWLPLPASGSGNPFYYEQWEAPELRLSPQLNTLEYRDDNGTRQIGIFQIFDIGGGCRYPRSTSIGTVQFPIDPSIYVRENNVTISYPQVPGLTLQFSLSQDGVSNYRGTNNSATWTAAEIAAFGTDNIIPAVWTKNVGNSCTMMSADDVWYKNISPPLSPLQAVANVSDVTVAGGTDGSITVVVSGGSGARTVVWSDDPTTSLFRDNLPKGTYTVTITDSVTDEVVTLNILVNEPELIVRIGTFFDVPMLNSMRFVVNPVKNHDNKTTFQNTRNTLFRYMRYVGFEETDFYEPRILGDAPIAQWNSDYPMHSVDLFDYCTGNIVKSFGMGLLKEQNVGVEVSYSIVIRNDTGNVGKSRVYFNTGAIPLPLEIGMPFTVVNNIDGYNGTYAIVDIRMDTTLNYQYLVINKQFTGPTNSNATGIFQENRQDYNVYEQVMDLSGIPEGVYYVRIAALDDVGNNPMAFTEPQDIRENHEGTVLFEYRNTDNADDMTWKTGYIGQIRVPSILFEEGTGGSMSTTRNAQYSLNKLSSKTTHTMKWDTYMLPPWLHVKIGCAVQLDFWYLNKVRCQTSDRYEDPKYIDRFKLANSSLDLEEYQFFRSFNTRGITSVEGGFVIANQGLLRR